MKKQIRQQLVSARIAAALILGLAGLVFLVPKVAFAQRAFEAQTGELIVKFRDRVDARAQSATIRQRGDRVRQNFTEINSQLIELRAPRFLAQALAEYARDPRVEYVEPNYIWRIAGVPNDTRFPELYGLNNTGQSIRGTAGTFDADIDAVQAWDVSGSSDPVVVGVVDTGIDYVHPDLAASIWTNPGGIGGCPAGSHGFNAINQGCNPLDDNAHGTHVSGTTGAVMDNGQGVAGVASSVQIMGLKFLNANGSGTTADAIEAIQFAIQAKQAGVNLRVLSNSWGGGAYSQALLDAINTAGANDILFVAAAGNNGRNTDSSPAYPASYSAENIISVAATNNRDGLASFSNYGVNSVDLGAPGVDVLSTTPSNSYSYYSGTSMATPHVSGAAALVLQHEPGLGTAGLKSRLMSSVDLVSSLNGRVGSGGRLNVCRAIPGCVLDVPPPTYTLSISPTSVRVPTGGQTVHYTLNLTRSSGNTNPISFSISGLPSSIPVPTIAPNPTTASSAAFDLVVSRSVRRNTYVFSVTAKDDLTGLTRSVSATIRKR